MSVARPYVVDTRLTGIALAYANKAFIADAVLPRVSVSNQSFKWLRYTRDERFTIPNTLVARKSRLNEVEFTATEVSDSVADYGLSDVVPNDDIAAAPEGYDPLGNAAEGVTDLVMLDREKRVADLVFANASYAASNRVTLSGTSQWSDFTNSDPVAAIMNALDGMLMRPNMAVFGRRTFTTLRRHPRIIAAVVPNGGNASVGGVASLQAMADLFELDRIVIGEAYWNTAKPGQTASLARLWGNHAAFLHQNALARSTTGRQMTYGYTAQWQTRVARQQDEPQLGLRGARRISVGESVKEIIAASDVGYYFENAVG
jgi:hypothetical protein